MICSTDVIPRAVLTINKNAIKHNVKELYRYTKKKIIAVIKSDAYGMGVEYIAPILNELEEIDSFAVANVSEGICLRELGIKKEILVLGGIFPEEVHLFKEYELTPVVSDKAHLKALENTDIRFHVKYDTGMGRLGFLEEFIDDERITGVMSHLSTPADREFSELQIERFKRIVKKYKKPLKVHLESSAGIIYRVPFTTHIRVGLAIYGERPLKNYPVKLKPAISIRARVISVKEVPKGTPISYGRTYITDKKTKIGIVAFGYADGLMKSLSNKGYLLFNGCKLKILGNITMDMTVVDAGDCNICAGDWITVIDENRTFGDLAREAGTIPYEIMCNISRRVKREVI